MHIEQTRHPKTGRLIVFIRCKGGHFIARELCKVRAGSLIKPKRREMLLVKPPETRNPNEMVYTRCNKCNRHRGMSISNYLSDTMCRYKKRSGKKSAASPILLQYMRVSEPCIGPDINTVVAYGKPQAAEPPVPSDHRAYSWWGQVMYLGYAVQHHNYKYELIVCDKCRMLVWVKQHKKLLKQCYKCGKNGACA